MSEHSAWLKESDDKNDHKFKIIGETKATDDEFAKYSATETTFEVIHKILIENCESNEYLLKLKRYILDYMIDKIHIEKDTGRIINTSRSF